MTEYEDQGAAPYPDAARARLAVAQAACELAELARAAVPVDVHALRPDGTSRTPGATVAEAVRVLGAAQRYVRAAAAFEELGRVDPGQVAAVLDPPPHQHGAPGQPSSADDHLGLLRAADAAGGSGDAWWRAYTAVAPLEAALDLDDWVVRHAEGDVDPGPAPVSGGLTPTDTGRS